MWERERQWQWTPAISVTQEDSKLEISPGNSARSCLKLKSASYCSFLHDSLPYFLQGVLLLLFILLLGSISLCRASFSLTLYFYFFLFLIL